MKKLTLSEWEAKYIAGTIERFDPKYHMFSRPIWDPDMRSRLNNWGFLGDVKDKHGFTLQDQALRWGSRRGTMIARFKSKINPDPVLKEPEKATADGDPTKPEEPEAAANPGRPTATLDTIMPMTYKLPEGVKADTDNPEKITRDIKKVARYFGASLVGVCKLDRRWVNLNEDIPEEFQYAIVMAFEGAYDLMKYYPSYIADAVTSMGYSQMAVTNAYLSAYIEDLGFRAIDSQNDTALSVPMAMQAGLGDVGRMGLLVTPQFGPRVRLSKVITDLPLMADSPIEFGVTEFCNACKKCAQLCPSQSISYGERTSETDSVSNNPGALKWPTNAETCRMYWGRVNKPCTSCIACCPYNKPYTWPHRATLWFTDHMRWADSLYVKLDDFFGYGKPKNAANFWEEWQPNKH
ncbi:reductive dehalogenase [Chloroflexota bacterium]